MTTSADMKIERKVPLSGAPLPSNGVDYMVRTGVCQWIAPGFLQVRRKFVSFYKSAGEKHPSVCQTLPIPKKGRKKSRKFLKNCLDKALCHFNMAWSMDPEDYECEKAVNLIISKLQKV